MEQKARIDGSENWAGMDGQNETPKMPDKGDAASPSKECTLAKKF